MSVREQIKIISCWHIIKFVFHIICSYLLYTLMQSQNMENIIKTTKNTAPLKIETNRIFNIIDELFLRINISMWKYFIGISMKLSFCWPRSTDDIYIIRNYLMHLNTYVCTYRIHNYMNQINQNQSLSIPIINALC